MAMKESNKDRAKRLAKESASVQAGTSVKSEPKSGVEGWIGQDTFPHAELENKHFKWIAIGVGVAIVALLII